MDRVLRLIFARLIGAGDLRVTTAVGSTFIFGDGTGTPAAIRFTTRAAQRRVLLDPALKFGEAYMDGGVVVEAGSIANVLAILLSQRCESPPGWARLRWPLARADQIRSQQRQRGWKLYSFHAPEVECIGKGKASAPLSSV